MYRSGGSPKPAPRSYPAQSDKEKKDLQIQLRSTKADLQRKADELADLQEEMSALKEASKEREKALKAKIKAVYEEHGRAAVDVSPFGPPEAPLADLHRTMSLRLRLLSPG